MLLEQILPNFHKGLTWGQEVVEHHRGLVSGTLEVGVLLATFSRELSLLSKATWATNRPGAVFGGHWISTVPCPILGSQSSPTASILLCSPRS